MTIFSVPRSDLPDAVFDSAEWADAHDWTHEAVSMFLEELKHESDQGQFHPELSEDKKPNADMQKFSLLYQLVNYLDKYPIMYVDKLLDPLIEDTAADLAHIRVPYPEMYINRKFSIPGGIIMGMFIIDAHAVMIQNLLASGKVKDKKEAEAFIRKQMDSVNVPELSPVHFTFFYVKKDEMGLASFGSNDVLKGNVEYNREDKQMAKQALVYAVNICTLINTHVDLKRPNNPKRDVRVQPYYPGGKRPGDKPTNLSVIRIFGNLKEYSDDYTKAKRKYTKQDQKAVVVRGHFRTLTSPRFTHKRGQTIWVPPFVRGMDKELFSRIVKVTL